MFGRDTLILGKVHKYSTLILSRIASLYLDTLVIFMRTTLVLYILTSCSMCLTAALETEFSSPYSL